MSDFYRVAKSTYGASGLELGAEDLALINKYTLRELSAGEVYAFKVTMCDNEVDRDEEAFDTATIIQLSKLYVGKTVIMDHNPKADKQCARIYSTEVITDEKKKTSYGEPYAQLMACCYMPRSEDAKSQIELIEAGIIKEVSVGASVKKELCSICGSPYWRGECAHHVGEKYDGKKCFIRLVDAVDAYELSFVAVPAQPAAGVTKRTKPEGTVPMRAELLELTGSVKEISAAVKLLEKRLAGGADVGNLPPAAPGVVKSADAQDNVLDLEVGELIESANALIKKIEGEI